MSRAKIDLLTEQTQYEFVEKGIRGGFTFVNQHHPKVTAFAIDPISYNPTLPRHEMLYVDANNLYGHALCELLPTSDFKWLSDEECEDICRDLHMLNLTSNEGYLLEVDLTYPSTIHDYSRDLPFCPEKMTVGQEHLSDFMKTQARSINQRDTIKTYEKLLLNQFDKEMYVVHARLLQFYIRQGMVLTKVHRGLKFKQTHVFRHYIEYNSKKRQEATTEFEKDYFKLKNNSLYGKMVENLRRRMNFKLCNSRDDFMTMSSKPSFLRSIIFNEDLAGVKLSKDMITLDRPVFIGQAVLDLAKLEMYELFYDKLKRYEQEFQCSISVVGGDTDSFFLSVTNCHVYRDLLPAMCRDELLDSSNFPTTHPLYSNNHKAQLGCIKDESEGHSYLEWMLLKPKAYSMKCIHLKGEKKRAKGVKRANVRELLHEDYIKAFEEQKVLSLEQRRITSNLHHMETITFVKQSLNFYEDKRHWVSIDESLPYGHYSLRQQRPVKLLKGNIPIPIDEKEEESDDDDDQGTAESDDQSNENEESDDDDQGDEEDQGSESVQEYHTMEQFLTPSTHGDIIYEVSDNDAESDDSDAYDDHFEDSADEDDFIDDDDADHIAGPSPKRRKWNKFFDMEAGVSRGGDDD